MEIIALLQSINHLLDKTTMRQLALVMEAMIAMTGRVTMLGISRWTEKGGSYRTVQRFFQTTTEWSKLNWHLFLEHRYTQGERLAIAGDHTVVTKSGKQTHGLGYFFSSIQNKPVKGIEFFSLSMINISRRKSSPILMEQTIRVKSDTPKKEEVSTSSTAKKNEAVQKEVKTKTIVTLNYRPTLK
jgi:putative transposase